MATTFVGASVVEPITPVVQKPQLFCVFYPSLRYTNATLTTAFCRVQAQAALVTM